MPARLTMDFEARSTCDLKKAGAWVYSEDPSTEVICLWFCSRAGSTFLWRPGDPEPPFLRTQIAAGAIFESHGFIEICLWRNIMVTRYGFPDIPNEQWLDTMALCARRALPLALGDVSKVLGLPVVKDAVGHAAMLAICKPKGKKGEYNEDPALYKTVIAYGEVDTKAQMHLGHRLGDDLEPGERTIWLLNQRMNLRGLAIDLHFAADCQAVYNEATKPLEKTFNELVGLKPKSPKMKDFLNEKLEAAGYTARFENMQKDTVAEALEDWDLPDDVRQIVEMRGALTSASVSKLAAMRACTGADGRARGLLQYHAATTGRDGGRLLQPTNFPRGTVDGGKDADGKKVPAWELLVPAIQSRDAEFVGMLFGDQEENITLEFRHLMAPVSAVTSALRHCLVSGPGKVLNAGDFSTIEAIVVLALAGQDDALERIAAGADLYCDFGTIMMGAPMNKKDNALERQLYFKPSVLGCGFGMGKDKFHRRYLKKEPFEKAVECIETYRKQWAPSVPKLWYGLEEAAAAAVWDRKPHSFRGIEYRIEDMWLTCRLHSGRKLYYFDPRKETILKPWHTAENPAYAQGFTYKAMKMGHLTTVHAYGGLLAENVTQATARDIMYDRALVLEAEGFPLVLNVYDECVAEVDEDKSNPKLMEEIMVDGKNIAWVKQLGIPVKAETWAGARYRK